MSKINRLVSATAAGVGAALVLRTLVSSKDQYSFAGRSVVIAGGSRGLGLALARAFAAEGARLALLAHNPADLASAETELAAAGAQVLALPCDIRDQAAVEAAVDRIIRHYGSIDVLVNDAGIVQVGPVEHMTIADFQDAMAVHVWGPLYTTLAVRPHMQRSGGGRIVNIASIGGKIAVPHLLPYTTSKFALVGLSDGLRAELAKDGIRVTTVCPGLMRTGSHVNALFKGRHRAEYTWFAILDALPVTSTSVRGAASQIVEACRAGSPQLTITPQARAAVLAQALFPDLVARLLALAGRLLPRPLPEISPDRLDYSDQAWSGWDSTSALAPSVLTALADRAVATNNEATAQPALMVTLDRPRTVPGR